jgi:hypothetical protein
MSAAVNLRAQRQKLREQLEHGSLKVSREDIERRLEQIDTALELLEWLPAGKDHDKP